MSESELHVITDGTWWGTTLRVDGEVVDALRLDLTIEVNEPSTATVTLDDGSTERYEFVKVSDLRCERRRVADRALYHQVAALDGAAVEKALMTHQRNTGRLS